MTNTIAPPTLEELNERIVAIEDLRNTWRDLPSKTPFDLELYCLYAVRDGVGAKRQTELEDANNACIELAAKHGYATGHGDTVGDIMREFNAQIPDRAQSPWMDIETAPKDGTEILGLFFYPRDEDSYPMLSGPWTTCFKDGKWRSSWDGEQVLEYMSDFGSEYKSPFCDPTHWMPLPEFIPDAKATHNHGEGDPSVMPDRSGGDV